MFEQFGNQGTCKFVLVQNNEAVPVVGPSNEILVLVIVEETVEKSATIPRL